jgi:hypothetical protein
MLNQFIASHRPGRAVRRAAVVLTAGLALGLGTVGSAHAATYRAPTTVANFCSFNRGLGRLYTGHVNGEAYAAWTIGTRYFDYYAFDTNGDGHVDSVAYTPWYSGAYHVVDFGLCAGGGTRWYNAATIEAEYRQQQARSEAAGNAAWGEMAPGLEMNAELMALDDILP